jgi:hypothetical protein
LASGVLFVILLAGMAVVFYQFLLVPLRDREATVRSMQDDIEKKQDRIHEVLASRVKTERWRAMSLPSDIDLARREYEKYLSALLRDSGFAGGSFSVVPKPSDSKTVPTIPGKGPVYTRLAFTVMAHGNLSSLVLMLRDFYRSPLLHQIKSLSIRRPLTSGPQQQADDLDIDVAIEALSVAGAGHRSYLLPNVEPALFVLDAVAGLRRGIPGLALAAWTGSPMGPNGPGLLARGRRAYSAIAAKNVFLGEPEEERRGEEVQVTRFVHLTDVTRDERRWEAFLYDRTSNKKTRLRAEAGFDAFRISDEEGEALLRGRVIRIDLRDVVFRVEDKYYAIHVGESLEEALEKPLSGNQVKELGLAAAPNAAGAVGGAKRSGRQGTN